MLAHKYLAPLLNMHVPVGNCVSGCRVHEHRIRRQYRAVGTNKHTVRPAHRVVLPVDDGRRPPIQRFDFDWENQIVARRQEGKSEKKKKSPQQ